MRSKFFKLLIPMMLVVHMNILTASAPDRDEIAPNANPIVNDRDDDIRFNSTPSFYERHKTTFENIPVFVMVSAIIFFNFYQNPASNNSGLTIQENIALELQTSRQNFLETHEIPEYEYPVITTSKYDEILKQQEILSTMKKTMVYKGTMQGLNVSLSGCLDVANIMARNEFMISGNGLIANSYARQATLIQGDFIVDSSVLYGKTSIDQKNSSVFFTSCFLDSLSIAKQDVVVVLLDTVVTGTITFNYPGTIIMNKNSYISGLIDNAHIVMIDNR